MILNTASEVARFSGSHAERLAEGVSSQMRRRPIGPWTREDGKPPKYKHYLILMRVQETAMLMLNGRWTDPHRLYKPTNKPDFSMDLAQADSEPAKRKYEPYHVV